MYSLYVLRTARRGGEAVFARGDDPPKPPRSESGISDIEVGLQAVAAALPAVTGFLVPAERRGRVELVERVAHTTPARSREAIHKIRDPLSVQTPADSPYGVLLAFSTASAGVRKVSTDSTGPKISSRAMRCACETPVNTVGGNQKPLTGSSHGGDQRCAPSASPISDSSRILASWAAELIAPTSVFLSSGSPRRSVVRRRCSDASTWS